MEIEKPISVTLEEAKQSIIQAVNGCKLHPSLLEPIIKDIYLEVQQLALKQYEVEKLEYERSLKELKESKEPKESAN
jgi:hypothetical protein